MKAVVICISAPYPVSTGTRIRSNSVIQALLDLGYEVSIIYPRDSNYGDAVIARKLGVAKAVGLPIQNSRISQLRTRILEKLFNKKSPQYLHVRLGLRARWALRKFSRQPLFDLSITEYSTATSIQKHIPAKFHVLDTCDIMSIHMQKVFMVRYAIKYFGKYKDSDFLKLDFWDGKRHECHPEEMSDFKRYDSIIAISEQEWCEINRLNLGIPNTLIPPCVRVPEFHKNDYSGPPVFAFSPNIFNVQGLLHFIHRLLPSISKIIPDFRLIVTGNPPEEAHGCPHLICTGYVDDLKDIYARAGFAIIPAYGGTGQQLKVTEAMSYGLAVVGYRNRIDQSILGDSEANCLARNEEEFVESVVQMWNDRIRAASIGQSSLAKVLSHLSQNSFTHSLRGVIEGLESSEATPVTSTH